MRPNAIATLSLLSLVCVVAATATCSRDGIIVPLGGAGSAQRGGAQNAGGSEPSLGGQALANGGSSSRESGGSGESGGSSSSTIGGGLTGGTHAGGTVAKGGAGGGSGAGGASGVGGTGGTSTGGASVAPGPYALNPPRQCGNQFYAKGCINGDTNSTCAGKCSSINACQESTATKPGNDVTFLCPRFMLYSNEMIQAAGDDGNAVFNYAVVGHDVDSGGIDGSDPSACCQCYQLVFDYPAENQANVNANPSGPSAIPIPPPLIVQVFNSALNGTSDFDIYLGAGGFGSNNACDPNAALKAVSGSYSYLAFPPDGEPNQGGVKGAGIYTECKTASQWVTTESIASAACQGKVTTACNLIRANDATIQAETIRSCTKSNEPNTYYHLNWNVYVKKVECPVHLTEVTGCKLLGQGLPAVNRNVTTAAAAAADTTFRTHDARGTRFSTNTMQDCCKPACAWQDKVSGLGLKTNGLYNSFYSCGQSGVPFTE